MAKQLYVKLISYITIWSILISSISYNNLLMATECGETNDIISSLSDCADALSNVKPETYSITNEAQRVAWVKQIVRGGKTGYAKTTLNLSGGEFDVFNDALTLPDGTYVNLTYGEAKAIAKAWGCQLPNKAQAAQIRQYAERHGGRVKASTYLPNNSSQRYTNMTRMMNNPQMHTYAEMGKTKLINGHFKWYVDDGSDKFRFYGFYVPGGCRSGYCQNGGSGGHDKNWIDYSQTARLICKKG